MVKKKSNLFTIAKHAEEVKLPPVLALQIWDYDIFSPDDYVSTPASCVLPAPAFPPFKMAASSHRLIFSLLGTHYVG